MLPPPPVLLLFTQQKKLNTRSMWKCCTAQANDKKNLATLTNSGLKIKGNKVLKDMVDHAAPAVVCQSNDFPPTAAISPSTITRLFPVYCSGEHSLLPSTRSNRMIFKRESIFTLSLVIRKGYGYQIWWFFGKIPNSLLPPSPPSVLENYIAIFLMDMVVYIQGGMRAR